jgi:hypothetical protein
MFMTTTKDADLHFHGLVFGRYSGSDALSNTSWALPPDSMLSVAIHSHKRTNRSPRLPPYSPGSLYLSLARSFLGNDDLCSDEHKKPFFAVACYFDRPAVFINRIGKKEGLAFPHFHCVSHSP